MRIKKGPFIFAVFFFLLGYVFFPLIFSGWNAARILITQTLLGILGLVCSLILLNLVYPERITLFIKISVIVFVFLIARIFLYYAGGPITWDEMYYMYLSLFPMQESSLLNRYFHIYLQRFFFLLTDGDPFQGAKLFSTFQIFATAVFIFLSAYKITPSKDKIICVAAGFFALIAYFTFPYVLDYPGVTYVDYTIMLLGSMFIYLYLLAREKPANYLFILLGLIFFLSMKTKEVGICLGVFFFDKELYFNKGQKKNIFRTVLMFASGLLMGMVVIAILDHFFLGYLFYSFRFSSWQVLLSYHTLARDMYDLVDLFVSMAKSGVIYYLLFSLLSMWMLMRNDLKNTAHDFLWVYCILVLAFHLLSAISGARMIVVRFFVVLAPVFAVLCSQIISGIREIDKRKLAIFLFTMVICAFISIFAIGILSEKFGWENDLFSERIFIPMIVLAFLCSFYIDKRWIYSLQIGLVLLTLFTYFPYKIDMIHDRVIEHSSQRRFQPMAENSNLLIFQPDMTVFVSEDIYSQHQILGRDRESNSWMYSLLFNQNTNPNQFVYGAFEIDEFYNQGFTYAFVSDRDWLSLSENGMNDLYENYTVVIKNDYTLLAVN